MKARAVIVVVLVAAAMLAGLAASMDSGQKEAPSVTVPNGSIGDVVTYHVMGQHGTLYVDGVVMYPAWKEGVAIQVTGPEDVMDQHGGSRQVVRAYLVGGEFGDGTTHQRTEYVDLGTRDIIRVDTNRQETDASINTLTWFGPLFTSLPDHWNPPFRFTHSNQTFLRFEDRTFTLGEDLTSQRGSGIAADVAAFGTPRTISVSSHVDRYGSYQGGVVLGVTDRWNVSEPDLGRRETGYQVTWISPDLPYPVSIERHWRKDLLNEGWWESDNKTSMLVSWEPGEGNPIPWRSGAPRPATVQWSSGLDWLPEEGTGSRLPIKVPQASKAVVDDLTLDGFAVWRAANPGWRVVGFDLRAGTAGYNDLPGHVIELTYAAPGGDTAYRVGSTYAHPAFPPVNDNGREFALKSATADHRLSGAGPPSPPVTWTHIDTLWRSLGQNEMTANAPDRVQWAYARLAICGEGNLAAVCDMQPSDELMSHVRWGHERLVQAAPQADPQGFMEDYIELATHDNRLVFAYRADGPSLFDPLFIEREPAPVVEDSFTGAPVVQLDHVALFAAGLLAVAALALWANTVKAWLTKALLWAGFTRLSEREILGLPARAAILQAIRSDPGLNATEVSLRLSTLGWSTVVYHLSVLERHGLVQSIVDGRHRRFFPEGLSRDVVGATTALRNRRTRAIHSAILPAPGMDRKALARQEGISVPGVLWHLDRLAAAGLVEPVRVGRRVVYRATQAPSQGSGPSAGSTPDPVSLQRGGRNPREPSKPGGGNGQPASP